MAQKPFDESIVQMLMKITAFDTVEFEQWCELVEITFVPKGHREILDALKAFARRSKFGSKSLDDERLPHYAAATKALEESITAAKRPPEPKERHHM